VARGSLSVKAGFENDGHIFKMGADIGIKPHRQRGLREGRAGHGQWHSWVTPQDRSGFLSNGRHTPGSAHMVLPSVSNRHASFCELKIICFSIS
jgi:hypothetical protein